MATTSCRRCGAAADSGELICSRCGQPLADSVTIDRQAGVDGEIGDGRATAGRHQLAGVGPLLGRLTPFLIPTALGCAALGQYGLSAWGASTVAAALYGIAAAAFTLALVGERFVPANQAGSVSGRYLLRLLGRVDLPAAAVVLLIAPWFTVNNPSLAIPGLIAWIAGLVLALIAAVPPHASIGASVANRGVRLWKWLQTREGIAALVVIVAGAALRLYSLADIPSGIHGDEAEFALLALTVLRGQGPQPFGTAFLGDPALYLYFEAPFLALLGQTVVGMRALAAVSGILTLPALFLLVRRLFGPHAALIALILAAGSAVHIHFSRMALNAPQVPLLTCLATYALWRGYETRQGFWWFASGVLGAFAVYFHFAGRLFPLVMGLFLSYLLVFERGSWRDWLRGAVAGLMGGIATLAPMAIQLAGSPGQFTGHMTDRLIFTNWDRMIAVHHTSSVPEVLWEQTKVNLLAFVSGMNGASFYPYPGQAMLAFLLGPIFVFALIFTFVRFRDPRVALLCLSFWTIVLVNGILTIDAPQPHRLLPAVLPAIGAMGAVLHWIARLAQRLTPPALASAWAGSALLVAVAGGYADCAYYFGPGLDQKPWEPTTAQAKFVSMLGADYRVYTLGTPHIYFNHGVTRYLAPTVEGDSLHNPVASLPIPPPAGRNLAFLVYEPLRGYLPIVQTAYPNAKTEVVKGRAGTIFTAVLVANEEESQWQGLAAQYPDGQRLETDPGQLGGGASAYPATVTWSGSLYIDRAGPYAFSTEGVPLQVAVDGAPLTTGQRLHLAVGWHALELKGSLSGPQARAALKWQPPGQQPAVVPTHALDARSLIGGLQCRIEFEGGDVTSRRDRAIGFRSISDLTGISKPAALTWDGSLTIQQPGSYTFALNSTGEAQVTIDGKQVLANPGTNSDFRTSTATVDLSQGPHAITVRYVWRQFPGLVELLWTPPGGQQSIVPPEAFGPSRQ